MKKLTKMAIVAAGCALATRGVFAGGINGYNDLVLDINNNDGGGTTEYDVNVGTVASLQAAGPNDNLSSLMSTFNTQYASATATGLNVGAVAGQNGQGTILTSGVGNDVFVTTLRVGNSGNYQIAGTEAAPGGQPSYGAIAAGGGIAAGLADTLFFDSSAPTQNANIPAASTLGESFSSSIAEDPSHPGTFTGLSWQSYLSDNPLSTMMGSTITLDLWSDTQTTALNQGAETTGWTYVGDLKFTYDPTGATPATLIWDAAAPEPATYGLLSAATLMIISFRSLKLPLGRKTLQAQ